MIIFILIGFIMFVVAAASCFSDTVKKADDYYTKRGY